jgi:asparagine synthetase B (glutamine-hydrolysing)
LSVALEETHAAPDTSSFLLRFKPGDGPPRVSMGATPADVARFESSLAVFDGHVFDRAALAAVSGSDPATADAELVLKGYLELGADVLRRIDGVFATVIWDGRSDSLVAARDPLGQHPLFYARAFDSGWWFSDSLVALARADDVAATLNKTAIAEGLINYHLDPSETYFEAIHRVPAGRALTVAGSGVTSSRYWDPAPLDQPVEWISEGDLPHLSTLLERALERALQLGRPSIFLSGGIDSVAVATYAADGARAAGVEPPIALSLIFPDPNFDEEPVQRLVARELGLPQTVTPFAQAEGPSGLVLEALRTTASWPMPLINIWHPLYSNLAREGVRQGAKTVLTGAGGDEWLSVAPSWAADCIRGLHFRELHHFWLTYRNSYTVRKWPMLRNLLWRYGTKVVLKNAGRDVLGRITPQRLDDHRRRRLAERMDPWLTPDRELAAQVEERTLRWSQGRHSQGAYLSDVVPYFENVAIAMEREEAFERGRRVGFEPFMPFWDPDVVDFLLRTPPRLLHAGHRAKGILRGRLAARFPTAGFEDQKKVLITEFSTSMLTAQIPGAWEKFRGAPVLSSSGIVDGQALELAFQSSLEKLKGRGTGSDSNVLEFSMLAHKLWSVLNLEAWVRQWA